MNVIDYEKKKVLMYETKYEQKDGKFKKKIDERETKKGSPDSPKDPD